jgi:arylsulfatase A-like enzyme
MKSTRRLLILLLTLIPWLAAAAGRPNILWLVSEDNNPLLGCYGEPLARTPALDKLAAEGVLFDRCFAQPVCAPSRFTLITGTFAVSSGPANHMRAQGGIPDWIKGFPELLRAAGYYTANNAKTDYNSPIDLKKTWNESGKKAHYRNRTDASQPFSASSTTRSPTRATSFPRRMCHWISAPPIPPGCASLPISRTPRKSAPTGRASMTTSRSWTARSPKN